MILPASAARLFERFKSPPERSDEFQPLSVGARVSLNGLRAGKLLAIDRDARLILQQLGVLDGVNIDQFTPALL